MKSLLDHFRMNVRLLSAPAVHGIATVRRAIRGAERDAAKEVRQAKRVVAKVERTAKADVTKVERAVGRRVATERRAAKAGVKNIAEYDRALAKGALRDAKQELRAGQRGVGKVAHGTADLLSQSVGDARHGVWYALQVVTDMLKSVTLGVWHVIRTVTAPAVWVIRRALAPIGKVFERQAKEEALGVTSTPTHGMHWELFGLLGGAVVLVIAALLFISNANQPTHLHLYDRAVHLATLSPEQLVVIAATFLALVGGTWFWVVMVRDSMKRTYATNVEQTKWKVTTLLLFIPGAVLYFWHVYNKWSFKQFVSYHFVSVMIVAVTVVVGTSTYGTLWYFNQKAEASVTTPTMYKTPNLNLPDKSKAALLGRGTYGTPLNGASSGRTDPFAPYAGQPNVVATPTPSASPSATPAPTPLP